MDFKLSLFSERFYSSYRCFQNGLAMNVAVFGTLLIKVSLFSERSFYIMSLKKKL